MGLLGLSLGSGCIAKPSPNRFRAQNRVLYVWSSYRNVEVYAPAARFALRRFATSEARVSHSQLRSYSPTGCVAPTFMFARFSPWLSYVLSFRTKCRNRAAAGNKFEAGIQLFSRQHDRPLDKILLDFKVLKSRPQPLQ
jgi:hypothetical protein